MVLVRTGSLLVQTIRATQLKRLYQLHCIDNAIKLLNTRHPRDRVSRPQRPLHLRRSAPLRTKARRWEASGSEPAHRAHSDAEKHSIAFSIVSGTPTPAIAVRREDDHPSLSHARCAINRYQLGRMPCVATCSRNIGSQLVLPRKQ